jgi:hypothetical protein
MERLSVRFLKYDSTFIYVNFDNNLTLWNKIKKKKKKSDIKSDLLFKISNTVVNRIKILLVPKHIKLYCFLFNPWEEGNLKWITFSNYTIETSERL